MSAIKFDSVNLTLGAHAVFRELSLQFDTGLWHSVLGRSGVGKTSLLRLIAELQQPDSGSVYKEKSNDTQAIAYVPQEDSLLPWLTIVDNVQMGPRLRGKLTHATRQHAMELLEQVGLSQWEHALPATLSGGMRQRVALVRALLENPAVVLMDEPFSRLDAITRHELQALSFKLMKKRTVIMVTHDPQEALRLSDRIHVLQSGSFTRCHQISLPTAPLRKPDSDDVARQLAKLWTLLSEVHVENPNHQLKTQARPAEIPA